MQSFKQDPYGITTDEDIFNQFLVNPEITIGPKMTMPTGVVEYEDIKYPLIVENYWFDTLDDLRKYAESLPRSTIYPYYWVKFDLTDGSMAKKICLRFAKLPLSEKLKDEVGFNATFSSEDISDVPFR